MRDSLQPPLPVLITAVRHSEHISEAVSASTWLPLRRCSLSGPHTVLENALVCSTGAGSNHLNGMRTGLRTQKSQLIVNAIADPEFVRCPRQDNAMLRRDLRVQWKIASALRFHAAIFEQRTTLSAGVLAIWLWLCQKDRSRLASLQFERAWWGKEQFQNMNMPFECKRTLSEHVKLN